MKRRIAEFISHLLSKKTPRVIQMEAAECGAAVLSMILGYYGRYVSLEELRTACGVSRDGASAYNIIEAAKDYGMEAEGYELTFDEIEEMELPLILFWKENHFIVLERIQGNRAFINDPATGPRWIHTDELKAGYSELAIECVPSPEFEPGGKSLHLFPRLIERIRPYKQSLYYLLAVQLTLIIIGLTAPVFSQIFIDKFLTPTHPGWTKSFFYVMGIVMVITGIVTYFRGRFLNALGVKLAINYSTEFLWHTLRLPTFFFTQRSGGEVINRINLNVGIANVFTGEVVINFISMVMVAFYGIIMFSYNATITSVAIATATFNFLFLLYVNRIRSNAYASLQQEQAKTIGATLTTLENIETIKTTANDAFFFSRIAGYYTRGINALQSIGRKDNALTTLTSLSQQLSAVLLLTLGCYEVLNSRLTIGMLIAFQILLQAFLRPFKGLVTFGAQLQTVKVDISRVDDVLQNKVDPLTEVEREATEGEKLSGTLELKKVTYGYCPLEEPLILDFSLKIKPGEMVALVGPTGSGKTTLLKVATSLYQPWSGEVLHDKKHFKEIPREVLRDSLAHVDQQIHLFEGTIKDNITLWDSTVPDEDVWEALRLADLYDEVKKMNNQIRFELLEDGGNLSFGQRQRVEIARALLRKPSLLVMDEATNSIDASTEETILKNLKKEKTTLLIVSHRLSTIKNATKILVLDEGKVVAEGSHDELKTKSPLYKKLLEYEIKH